jgi:hypothetical protein
MRGFAIFYKYKVKLTVRMYCASTSAPFFTPSLISFYPKWGWVLYMFNTACIYAWSYIDSLSFLVNISPSCGHVYSMTRKLCVCRTTINIFRVLCSGWNTLSAANLRMSVPTKKCFVWLTKLRQMHVVTPCRNERVPDPVDKNAPRQVAVA